MHHSPVLQALSEAYKLSLLRQEVYTQHKWPEQHKAQQTCQGYDAMDWIEWSLTPHPTQYRSFRRRSSQPIT